MKDAVIADNPETGESILIALTNGGPENAGWLRQYPEAYVRVWCDLDALAEEFGGEQVYDLYSQMSY